MRKRPSRVAGSACGAFPGRGLCQREPMRPFRMEVGRYGGASVGHALRETYIYYEYIARCNINCIQFGGGLLVKCAEPSPLTLSTRDKRRARRKHERYGTCCAATYITENVVAWSVSKGSNLLCNITELRLQGLCVFENIVFVLAFIHLQY